MKKLMELYVKCLFTVWLRKKFAWTPHNLVAHPLTEVAHWFGFENFSNWLHDGTVPNVPADEQRG